MTFPSLDPAESALDWIGVEFADGDGCFEGTLAADDADLLDAALTDPRPRAGPRLPPCCATCCPPRTPGMPKPETASCPGSHSPPEAA